MKELLQHQGQQYAGYESGALRTEVVANAAGVALLHGMDILPAESKQQAGAEFMPEKQRFLGYLDRAVSQGHITADMVSEEVRSTVLQASFDIHNASQHDPAIRGARAYTNPGKGTVTFRSERVLSEESTVNHELLHVITGQTEDTRQDWRADFAKPAPTIRGYGLMRLAPTTREERFNQDSNIGLQALNEAVTDWFSLDIMKGGDTEISPWARGAAYRTGLMLFRSLCKDGVKPVDPYLFVRAMLAGNDRADGMVTPRVQTAFGELHYALQGAFPGVNVVKQLSDLKQVTPSGSVTRLEVRSLIKKLQASTKNFSRATN